MKIEKKEYLKWRSPRFGVSNPEKVESKVYEWLFTSKLNGYCSNEDMNGPSSFDVGPAFSFDRFGQSETELPDGRKVYIAGEHEDSYDPDFYIYNDIVVEFEGSYDFYLYPKEVFRPTDFHSSTIVGENIICIGNLGYYDERQYRHTQVYMINTNNFHITEIQTTGELSGWIHSHRAVLSKDGQKIHISEGLIDKGEGGAFYQNYDEWELDLKTWSWRRITEKNYTQKEIVRSDGASLCLGELRHLALMSDIDLDNKFLINEQKRQEKDVQKKSGKKPDLNLLSSIYNFGKLIEPTDENDDEYGVYRVEFNKVIIKFTEKIDNVIMVVEGELETVQIKELEAHVQATMGEIEGVPCLMRDL